MIGEHMSILDFIAAMTKALAWPLIVLIGIVVFRVPFAERIRSVRKISHGKTVVLWHSWPSHAPGRCRTGLAA